MRNVAKSLIWIFCGLALYLSPAFAAVQQKCDGLAEANAVNLVFQPDKNTKTYSNGAVRLVHLNTFGEPAGGASHLMVSWDKSEIYPSCRLISAQVGLGFRDIFFSKMKSSYDPNVGLTIRVPVAVYDGTNDIVKILQFTLNRAKDEIDLAPLRSFAVEANVFSVEEN